MYVCQHVSFDLHFHCSSVKLLHSAVPIVPSYLCMFFHVIFVTGYHFGYAIDQELYYTKIMPERSHAVQINIINNKCIFQPTTIIA